MITLQNRSSNKHDHYFPSFHFHIKHLVSPSQRRRSFQSNTITFSYLELLSNYPSSIVTLSLLLNVTTSDTFVIKQIGSILFHKKDELHYRVSQHAYHFPLICTSLISRSNYYIVQSNFKVLLHHHDLISSLFFFPHYRHRLSTCPTVIYDRSSSSTIAYSMPPLDSNTLHDIQ